MSDTASGEAQHVGERDARDRGTAGDGRSRPPVSDGGGSGVPRIAVEEEQRGRRSRRKGT